MFLGKYFRREKFTYWFLAFLPVILVAELWLYFVGTHKMYGEASECFTYFLWPLALMTSAVLVFVQMMSVLIYFIRWCKLTPEQKMGVRNAACNSKKTGRILQSEEVLIYYGMFSKKILFRSEITSMQRAVDKDFRRVRGGSIASESDYIRVTLKSGKKADLMCNIKVLDGYQGELPWDSIGAVVLLGVAVLIMGSYPLLMNCIVGKEDVIKRILFFAGYDWLFWLVSAVFIAVFAICLFRMRKKYLDESYKGLVVKSPMLFYAVIIVIMFAGIVFRDKYDESQLARADLKAYMQGQYEQKITYMRDVEEGHFSSCANDYIYHYMDVNQIAYACPECMEDGNRWEEYFLLINLQEWPKLEQTYRLYYLENTKIIVALEEM